MVQWTIDGLIDSCVALCGASHISNNSHKSTPMPPRNKRDLFYTYCNNKGHSEDVLRKNMVSQTG